MQEDIRKIKIKDVSYETTEKDNIFKIELVTGKQAFDAC